MKLSQLVFKSMLKNMKHYYLYFFALIFSVTLYFSFMTLQYNPAVIAATEASGTATSGLNAATYLLYFVVLFFVLYANHLFIKRRSKEIGLYQLIGMTKGLVIRLVALENIVLFIGAVVIGIGLGLLSSRLFAMILLKLLQFDTVVTMTFTKVAFVNTAAVFGILLLILLVQMAWMVKRTTLLLLFTASKQADERVKRFSPVKMIIGAFGLVLIVYGYYKSSILFTAASASSLLFNMLVILVATIGGTFLVFRFSVSFLLNVVRLRKKGHLRLVDVLALTPIMHRMKGNAKSLTLITVLTAVSLAITTLSYISYYSAHNSASMQMPADYISVNGNEAAFLVALDKQQVVYETQQLPLATAKIDLAEFLPAEVVNSLPADTKTETPVISLSAYQQLNPAAALKAGEVIIAGYNGFMANMMPLEPGFEMTLHQQEQTLSMRVVEVSSESLLAWRITGGSYVLIVQDELFEQFRSKSDGYLDVEQQTAIHLSEVSEETLLLIEKLYKQTGANVLYDKNGELRKLTSLQAMTQYNLNNYGMTIFTTAFLGLAFLLASGSILYFKQMSEADEEVASFAILRKIGFTKQEILRGIMIKQAFNFGVPLVIGLLHSYFAVKSGWFLFGTEMVLPLVIVMGIYIILYSIFALLSLNYYKKIIKQAL
ncbi:MAG: ABC transporter permease [Solibacillus sp.]